jgi:hypothetical protein
MLHDKTMTNRRATRLPVQGTTEIIREEELRAKLEKSAKTGKPLRVKTWRVYVNGERCDPKVNKYYTFAPNKPGYDVQVGKRRFVKIRGE